MLMTLSIHERESGIIIAAGELLIMLGAENILPDDVFR
jgi:hypothetical protein